MWAVLCVPFLFLQLFCKFSIIPNETSQGMHNRKQPKPPCMSIATILKTVQLQQEISACENHFITKYCNQKDPQKHYRRLRCSTLPCLSTVAIMDCFCFLLPGIRFLYVKRPACTKGTTFSHMGHSKYSLPLSSFLPPTLPVESICLCVYLCL